jgi:hypothetical protein
VNNSDGSKGGESLNFALAPPLAIGPVKSWQAGVKHGAPQFLRKCFPYDQNDHMKMVILGIDLPACLSYCQTLFINSHLKTRSNFFRNSRILIRIHRGNMSNQQGRSTEGEPRRERPQPYFTSCKAVIVLVAPDETEEQAWRSHIKKHPEDIKANVRIFHIC